MNDKHGENKSIESENLPENTNNILSFLSTFLELDMNLNNIIQYEQVLRKYLHRKKTPLKIKRLITSALIIITTIQGKIYSDSSEQELSPFGLTAFVSSKGLNLRAGPSTELPIIRSYRRGTMVKILGYEGEYNQWAVVDLNGDGVKDGDMYALYLYIAVNRTYGIEYIPDLNLNADACSPFQDSGERLCYATDYSYGINMLWGHNFYDFGKQLVYLSENVGTVFSLNVNGQSIGTYKVIESYKVKSGFAVDRVIHPTYFGSINNGAIVGFTSDPNVFDPNDLSTYDAKVVFFAERVGD